MEALGALWALPEIPPPTSPFSPPFSRSRHVPGPRPGSPGSCRPGLSLNVLSAHPLTRNASEPCAHHGEAGAGPVRAVSPGDGQGWPGGSHQPEGVARGHTRPQPAHHHHVSRLHSTHPVRPGAPAGGGLEEGAGGGASARGWPQSGRPGVGPV